MVRRRIGFLHRTFLVEAAGMYHITARFPLTLMNLYAGPTNQSNAAGHTERRERRRRLVRLAIGRSAPALVYVVTGLKRRL